MHPSRERFLLRFRAGGAGPLGQHEQVSCVPGLAWAGAVARLARRRHAPDPEHHNSALGLGGAPFFFGGRGGGGGGPNPFQIWGVPRPGLRTKLPTGPGLVAGPGQPSFVAEVERQDGLRALWHGAVQGPSALSGSARSSPWRKTGLAAWR